MLSWFVVPCLLVAVGERPYEAWVAEPVAAAELPSSVVAALSSDECAALGAAAPQVPYTDPTVGLRAPDGTVWLGTPRGLMHLPPGADAWRLFHSRRWLPHDEVTHLALDAQGTLWVATRDGVVRLKQQATTLEAKMAEIHQALRAMHVQHGLVGSIHLHQPGTTEHGWTQHSNDNDGLWTSLYVAAEAFRYGVTGDEEARRNARESLDALLLLESVTGLPGYVARSVVPGDEPPPRQRYGGQWQHSADGKWWWKGDTSSDELDGHYFAYAVYYDLVADAEEKAVIAAVVARITDHILDHDYYYVGPDGKPTTWGVWAPEKLNHDLEWILDRGLNSLELLSHLKVAHHVTGDSRYEQAARELIEQHSYHINTVRQKVTWPATEINHSDDELAFLAYYPLLWYERDPELRRVYLTSIEWSWQVERPEHSPLFGYIYAAARQADEWTQPDRRPSEAFVPADEYDAALLADWFREVPSDMIEWTVVNSGRADLGALVPNRFGRDNAQRVLPVAERRLMRWNGDPYELDGGAAGHGRDDGTYVLLPYWMGRWHRFLE